MSPVPTAVQPDTTGAVPPPLVKPAGGIDWRTALACGAAVAGVGALLSVLGLALSGASFLSTVWAISAAVIVLGLYAKRRPQAAMNAQMGLKIGVVSGLLLVAAMGIALAASGLVVRFGTHGMAGFDQQVEQQSATLQTQMTDRMKEQGQDAEMQQRVLGFMGSKEVRGGLAMVYAFFTGGFLLVLSAGGGAFAGMLQGRRRLPVVRE